MIKVVRIIARLNVGGPARHVLLLARELEAFGFETVVLTGEVDAGEAELVEAMDGVRIVRIPGLVRRVAPLQDLRALAALTAALRRERPAVVHTHTAKAGALGRVAARLAGVPVVVHTFHGHVLTHYFGPSTSTLVTWAERGLAHLAQRLVTLSPGLRRELAEEFRVAPAERISVIPLGRDLEPFRAAPTGRLRAELGLGPEAFLVGGIGRLVPIKRFELMLEAFAPLAASSAAAHLVLVGDGPERGPLTERAAALGLRGRVHLLGWRADLPALLADLDLVALSSRNEGTPLAIVEAFAAGRAVVSTAVGGVAEMFSPAPGNGVAPPPGVTLQAEGALVDPDDPAALAAALQLYAREPALRQKCAARAREASRAWDVERLVHDVAALYRQLLQEHPRGAALLAREQGAT